MSNRVTVQRIERALRANRLRAEVGVIEENPASPGKVVLWVGGTGHTVSSVQEAIDLCRTAAAGVQMPHHPGDIAP